MQHCKVISNDFNQISSLFLFNIKTTAFADVKFLFKCPILPINETISSYLSVSELIIYNFKNEIISNIELSPNDKAIFYLDNILSYFNNLLKYSYADDFLINNWCSKYKFKYPEIIKVLSKKRITKLFYSVPFSYDETKVVNSNLDFVSIQNDFYNYIFSQNLFNIINFIKYQKTFLADFKGNYQLIFKNNLTPVKINNIYNKMQGRFIDTNLENFISIFTFNELPSDFVKIKWILLKKNCTPHKTALSEFLTAIFGKCPSQKFINKIITDMNGFPIILPKPKIGDYSIFNEKFLFFVYVIVFYIGF